MVGRILLLFANLPLITLPFVFHPAADEVKFMQAKKVRPLPAPLIWRLITVKQENLVKDEI